MIELATIETMMPLPMRILNLFIFCLLLPSNSLKAESGQLSQASGIRPNIIFMMADDMGIGDTSVYQDFAGNSDDVQVDTPQMERLARMGIRFTDAHTPATLCTPTRYSLMTGRYPWRSRLKHFVLYGVQGDPLIEEDRPTIATMLADAGYGTALVGKWHIGLRYRRSDGSPAAGWQDADLRQLIHDGPAEHGFQSALYTSRSHGTSGPNISKGSEVNTPEQKRGPGHIDGNIILGATSNGKQLVGSGPDAYILKELGGRHSDNAVSFIENHVEDPKSQNQPFFLYYACNANHGPYTPDSEIGGVAVAGASRSKSGKAMNARSDYIYENDVALGRLLDLLKKTNDPRNPGSKLIDTTLVIFTSDNGAEIGDKPATGNLRSFKGSVYEGGHRVPFIAAWANGGIGDGNTATDGKTSDALIGLQDIYATIADLAGEDLPNLKDGTKGAEDSFSILPTLRGESAARSIPMFFNSHKESKGDPAAMAMRLDNPVINGKVYAGKWKLIFSPALIRAGKAEPIELYELSSDLKEMRNRIDEQSLKPLVHHYSWQAELYRNLGSSRLVGWHEIGQRHVFDFSRNRLEKETSIKRTVVLDQKDDLEMTIQTGGTGRLCNTRAGMGVMGNKTKLVNSGESLLIRFNRDVIVESTALVAGPNGAAGGFYTVGNKAPLAIYCVDADNDSLDQSGILSDIGILQKGETLRLDSSPHHEVEAQGAWSIRSIAVRTIHKSIE